MKEHRGKHVHKLEYNAINEYIYIVTNVCCDTHFDARLRRKGIHADISLEENRIDSPFGISYYIWLPTKDHHAPPLDKLLFGAQCLDYFVRKKVKTYVHCKEGHTRAPTLVAAYLIYDGLTAQEAMKLVKKKRASAHITLQQRKALKEFEKLVH